MSTASSLAGTSASSAATVARPAGRAGAGHTGVSVGGDDAQAGQQADAAEIGRGRVGTEPTAEPADERRAKGHVGLEIAPARADQVMSDVGRIGAASQRLRGQAGAFDGAQRDAHLRLAGIGLAVAPGQFLDGVPVAVAAGEVHARVDACRIPPQDLLRLADLLHEVAPVERRTEPQAGDGVGRGELIGGLALVLQAHGILGRRPFCGQGDFDRRCESRDAGVELAHPLPELGDESARERFGQRERRRRVLQLREGSVGRQASRPPGQDPVGQDAQVLEQRELEHAGQGPELADRERRHRLEGEDEAGETFGVETPVAVTDQFERQGVDTCPAGELACRELGKRAVIAGGEVAADRACFGLDEVEVVQDPLGGGRDGDTAVGIVRERPVGRAEDAEVAVEPGQNVVAAGARCRHQREAGGERLGALLETCEAQELAAQRELLHGAPASEPSEDRPGPGALQIVSRARATGCSPGPRRGAGSRVPRDNALCPAASQSGPSFPGCSLKLCLRTPPVKRTFYAGGAGTT